MMRVAKIALMLAVYLSWICSNSVGALTCHSHRSNTHHGSTCSATCVCHHEGWDKLHVDSPHSCHHDHSNKIALYDVAKRNNLNIEPVEFSITALVSDNIRIEEMVSISRPQYYRRTVPIPPSPTLSRRGMRAPPVVA